MKQVVRLWVGSRLALCFLLTVFLPMLAVVNGYGVIWSDGRWIAKQGYYSMEINQLLGLVIVVLTRFLFVLVVFHMAVSLPLILEYGSLRQERVLPGHGFSGLKRLLVVAYWLLAMSATIAVTLMIFRA